jgi:hypothetical protein
MSSNTPTTKYIPDREEPSEVGAVHSWNHKYYRNQVQAGAPWDTTFAFRYAVAHAKDRARNELIRAIRMEAQRLQEESRTTLGIDYLTRNDDLASFDNQAKSNVLAQRKINGVEGAPDDAILL